MKTIPSVHEGIPVPAYLPESDDLIAARRAEMASGQTAAERQSDEYDLGKDYCIFHRNNPEPGCIRYGVPEVYSHLYDAEAR